MRAGRGVTWTTRAVSDRLGERKEKLKPNTKLVKMTEPLKGLGIGEQLAWYGRQG